jgi:hypothetical protein
MITSFFQVGIEGFSRLTGKDHRIVQLTIPAVAIMASTVAIKFLCWLWCRLIRNSSVQALAQDAMTDVVFNTFSIIFPLGMSYQLFLVSVFVKLYTCSLQSTDANQCYSWVLCKYLVARSPRWSAAFRIRHHQLVKDFCNTHP